MPKKQDEIIETQFNKEEREAAATVMRNFNTHQDRAMTLSLLDSKNVNPYLQLIPLKEFNDIHMQYKHDHAQ